MRRGCGAPYSSSRLITANSGGAAPAPSNKQLLGVRSSPPWSRWKSRWSRREIGEDGRVEMQAVHAAQRQRVRGDFHA